MSIGAVTGALNDIQKSARTDDIPGCWPGRIEDTNDPKRIGRVRVRVFAFHGGKESTSTIALPWAEVSSMNGGGYDYGSGGGNYPVGSNVWVIFAMGKKGNPVVIGGLRSKTRVKDHKNDGQILTLDGTSPTGSDETWIPAEDDERPKEVFANSYDKDNHPTIAVWQKSFKGHTIVVEDRDEHEFLRIIDRAGQIIEMSSPVSSVKNKNNSEQRGDRNASYDNQVQQSSLVNGRGFIRIRDVAGQEIILDGKSNNEEVRITSSNRQGSSRQQVILSSKKGREYIEITDKQGNSFKLDPNGAVQVKIEDSVGGKIEFDTDFGVVRTTAPNQSEEIVGSNKTTTIGGSKNSEVGGDDALTVLGNKFVNVMNDLASSIMGVTSVMATGPMKLHIVNAKLPAGAPDDYALDLAATIGGMKLHSLACGLGKMEFSTLLGNLKVDTAVGDAELGTVLGGTVVKATTALELGGAGSVHAASLDTLLQVELNKIYAFLTAFIISYNLHTHMYIAPLIPLPGPTIPTVPGTLPPGLPPTPVGVTGSTLVKILR